MDEAGAVWMGMPMKHISLVTVRNPWMDGGGIVLTRYAAYLPELGVDTGKTSSTAIFAEVCGKRLTAWQIMHYSRIMPSVGGHRYFASTAVFLNEVIKYVPLADHALP